MKKIAIIGGGVSGLMAANILTKSANVEVNILEEGEPYIDRINITNSSLVNGIGGAGTLYGGKFCFPPASSTIWKKTDFSNDSFLYFFNTYIKPLIPENDYYENHNKIHTMENIFTDVQNKRYHSSLIEKAEMHKFILNLLHILKSRSVEIKDKCKFREIQRHNDGYRIIVDHNKQIKAINYDVVIFATGRASANKIQKWLPFVPICLQTPDLGIRFSFKLSEHQYFNKIGKDVKIKAEYNDVGVRTFCVCSGGDKVLVDLNEMSYYDGHFDSAITDITNLGILARSKRLLGYEAAEYYCSLLNPYLSADLTIKDFVEKNETLIADNMFNEIFESIRRFIFDLQKNGILKRNLDEYPMWLPSVDNLNPIVNLNSNFESNKNNLYVIGDASGLSRGFIQSMWSSYCASIDIMVKLDKEQNSRVKRMVI